MNTSFKLETLIICECGESRWLRESPAKAASTLGRLKCAECKKEIASTNGILDLRQSQRQETLLDVDQYDNNHSVGTIKTSRGLWSNYIHLFSKVKPNFNQDNVLELAAGTGALTIALAERECNQSTIISDISPRMLSALQSKLLFHGLDRRCELVIFDANSIPLKSNEFDLVIGNSVLHHLSDFETTLMESYRVLKDGGLCAFGEPILDTHAFVSLISSLILATHQQLNSECLLLSPRKIAILKTLAAKAVQKVSNLNSNREKLGSIEDKFQFPITFIKSLAARIGYSQCHCLPPKGYSQRPSTITHLIRKQIRITFEQCNEDSTFLDAYEFIFKSLEDSYFEALSDYILPPFSFFVFEK